MSFAVSPPGSTRTQPTTAVVTIIAKNYLAQARVLMDSVKGFSPQFMRVVLLVDKVEDCFDPSQEDFALVSSDELEIPNSHWFHFKYSVMELCTAVKPYLLSWLIRTYHLEKVIYLDPDICLYASLAGIERALDDSNIVLTPHLTAELDDDRQPSELQILRTGAYNLGFIAVKATEEVDRFLNWWQLRLYDHCVVDLARGLFVDQRWIDLVPGLFSGVRILRDPCYNVAYWNAAHRKITWQNGAPFVNGEPLCFFHFSGYDPGMPDVLSKHQDRVALSDRSDLQVLCTQYRQDLFSRGYATAVRWGYSYSRFRNGSMIPDVGRHLLGEAPELPDEIQDPFSDEGFERMVELWNTSISRSSDGRAGVTKIAYRIYRMREDVQAAMPDIFGADHMRFLEWMLSSSPLEHHLAEPMLKGVRAALESAQLGGESSQPEQSGEPRDLPVICADLLTRGPNDPLLSRITKRKSIESAAGFNELCADDANLSHLTILARYIYESRPDLQRVFPDPQGRDAVSYLAWLLNYGRHSYGLTEEYLSPMRKSLAEIRSKLRITEKVHLDLYCVLLRAAIRLSPLTTAIRNVQKNGLSSLRTSIRRNRPVPGAKSAWKSAAQGPFGVNVYGYFRAETGVGQSARNAINALTSVEVPYSLHNLNASALSELDGTMSEFSDSAPYRANLYFVNADQTFVVHRHSSRSAGKYNIGFWTWELDELPHAWDRAFDVYDELWVPSGFCQSTIAARSPIPVIRIPYCISPSRASEMRREDFGIDSERFVFLTVFDMQSCFDRKNPLGVMRAFKQAFGRTDNCELVVKVNHAEASPEKLRCLRQEASGHSILLLEETFRRDDVEALIAASDCVVSLHRSEGFGLVLGEAMLLGKPVIATAYSGNLDFTTPNTSFLVPYHLQKVGPGNAPYAEDALWADPCLTEAAAQMRMVYEDRRLREQRAQAGRALIETRFSPQAVGALIKERLELTRNRR